MENIDDDETYQPGEKVYSWHNGLPYQATVLEVTEKDGKQLNLIHYRGWSDKWDERVESFRLLKWTPENRKMAAERHAEAKDREKMVSPGVKRGGRQNTPGTPLEESAKRQRTPEGDSARKVKGLHEASRSGPDRGAGVFAWTNMPMILKRQLAEDWKLVTQHHCLVILPASPSVAGILSEFLEQEDSRSQDPETHKVIAGLCSYFDKSLGTILLYRFERAQYADLLEKFKGKPMSRIYGAEHLLRFLLKFPALLHSSKLEPQARDTISSVTDHLVSWLGVNAPQFFSTHHFEPASPSYLRAR